MDKDFELELPFFTDDPQFALGVEVGMFYMRIKHFEIMHAYALHTENVAQIELMCIQAKAVYKFENIGEGWSQLSVFRYNFFSNN